MWNGKNIQYSVLGLNIKESDKKKFNANKSVRCNSYHSDHGVYSHAVDILMFIFVWDYGFFSQDVFCVLQQNAIVLTKRLIKNVSLNELSGKHQSFKLW